MLLKPDVKALLVCEDVWHGPEGSENLHLMNLFTAIRPVAGFPCRIASLCIFVHLVDGYGTGVFRVLARDAENDEVVFGSPERRLTVNDRLQPVRLVFRLRNCPFPREGIYLIELYCDKQWLADYRIILHSFEQPE